MQNFSITLRQLRESKGLSQKDFAKILGVDNRLISRLETGYNEPNLDQLKVFSDFFNCTIDYLIGREDEFGSIVIKDPVKSEIESLYDNLDPVKKHMALTYVKQLSAIQEQESDVNKLKKA